MLTLNKCDIFELIWQNCNTIFGLILSKQDSNNALTIFERINQYLAQAFGRIRKIEKEPIRQIYII